MGDAVNNKLTSQSRDVNGGEPSIQSLESRLEILERILADKIAACVEGKEAGRSTDLSQNQKGRYITTDSNTSSPVLSKALGLETESEDFTRDFTQKVDHNFWQGKTPSEFASEETGTLMARKSSEAELTSNERIELQVISAQLKEGIKREDPEKILNAAKRFIQIEEKFGFTSDVIQTPLNSLSTSYSQPNTQNDPFGSVGSVGSVGSAGSTAALDLDSWDNTWAELALPEVCDAINPNAFLDWLKATAQQILEFISQRLSGLKATVTPIMMATALFSHNPDGSLEATKFIAQEIRASAGAPMEEQIDSLKRVLIHMKEFAKENRNIGLQPHTQSQIQGMEFLKEENKRLKEKIVEMAM